MLFITPQADKVRTIPGNGLLASTATARNGRPALRSKPALHSSSLLNHGHARWWRWRPTAQAHMGLQTVSAGAHATASSCCCHYSSLQASPCLILGCFVALTLTPRNRNGVWSVVSSDKARTCPDRDVIVWPADAMDANGEMQQAACSASKFSLLCTAARIVRRPRTVPG